MFQTTTLYHFVFRAASVEQKQPDFRGVSVSVPAGQQGTDKPLQTTEARLPNSRRRRTGHQHYHTPASQPHCGVNEIASYLHRARPHVGKEVAQSLHNYLQVLEQPRCPETRRKSKQHHRSQARDEAHAQTITATAQTSFKPSRLPLTIWLTYVVRCSKA